jgi:hypothetical protein
LTGNIARVPDKTMTLEWQKTQYAGYLHLNQSSPELCGAHRIVLISSLPAPLLAF